MTGADQPRQRVTSPLPGIGAIPQKFIKATNSQMRSMYAIIEKGNYFHARNVRSLACDSYVTPSSDPHSFTGKHRDYLNVVLHFIGTKTPYYMLMDSSDLVEHEDPPWWVNQLDGISSLKIVSQSIVPGHGRISLKGSQPHYLVVQVAGNDGNVNPIADLGATKIAWMKAAIAANKLLLVAGWDRNAGGNFIRHSESNGCGGTDAAVSAGCPWAQYAFTGLEGSGLGTSYGTPKVLAALASVLAVFPDTTPQNLAKLAKACAKKTGQDIPALIAGAGGVGVADITCMGGVINALANLPIGIRTNVTINGKTVSVGGIDVTVSFTPLQHFAPPLEDETYPPGPHTTGFRIALHGHSGTGDGLADGHSLHIHVVPTGERKAMSVGTFTAGDMFGSLAFGTRGDFPGSTKGHESGVSEIRLTAGHINAFGYLSRVRSGGGEFIRSAEGRAAGLMIWKNFQTVRPGVACRVHAGRTGYGRKGEVGIQGRFVRRGQVSGWVAPSAEYRFRSRRPRQFA